FRENNQPLLFETLTTNAILEVQCLKHYYKEGGRSIILCPLKLKNQLIGMLEITSTNDGELKPVHINRLEPIIPLFTLGLEKSLDLLINKVDSVIKKKFTAVQPAVEWRFTEAALNYIVNKQTADDTRVERIA